jgi:CRP-like cAMP-binding protein
MSDDDRGISAGEIGMRLTNALEEYLSSANKRDDHLVKLMTVMAKLMADSQRKQPKADDSLADNIGFLAATLSTMVEGLNELPNILAQQSQINEMLAKFASTQDQRQLEAQAREIPSLSDTERRSDLEYVPYKEKEIAFMKESEVFGALSDDTLRTIVANSRLLNHPPGSTVFTIGDPVTEVFIIKSGIVEICRPTDDTDKMNVVAYLTSGDSIGEMSILLTGDVRSSMARVPEGAEILLIDYETFLRLFRGLPELGLRLASVFARRLKTSIKKERVQTKHRELSGTLQYFDLPTVIQTLLSSDERTGMLTVYDPEQDPIADLFFEAGSIKYAKVGHLFGEEAFYQLFQIDLSVGSFTFKERKFAEGMDERSQIDQPGMSLLFEAARLSDELKLIKEDISDQNTTFKLTKQTLEWDDDDSRVLANGIWNMLKRGSNISEILDNLPRSHYSIYAVLAEMKEKDLIE